MSSDSDTDTVIDEVSLDGRFDATVAASKSDKTRAIYNRMIKRLQKGLNVAEDASVESLCENEVLNFISSDSVKEDGTLKSASTPEAYRSALLHHFRSRNLPVPHNYEVVLNNFVKGHKANVASARLDGTMKATEGKDAIDFRTYKELSRRAWSTKSVDDALFFVLAWNMSCRATSANSVNLSHIQWREDCLFLTIPKSKTTQRGAQRGVDHAFSVYANPFEPSICCVLALGVKVLCTTMVREGGCIFGNTQKDTFADWLRTQENLDCAYSVDPSHPDIGIHSLRKGSLTWCMAFPGAVSVISALLRAGYTLGGVLPKYIALAIAGDQNVSRLLCGLPYNSEDYAALPPRFKVDVAEEWGELVNDWNEYPKSFQRVIPFLLASVVFHAQWLKATLPREHPLFRTRFWSHGTHERLADKVLPPTRMRCTETGMEATGVSQLTVVLNAVKDQSTASAVVPDYTSRFDAVNQRLDRLTSLVELSVMSATASTAATASAPPPLRLRQAATKDFVWPKDVTLREMHTLWHEGTPTMENLSSVAAKVRLKNKNLSQAKTLIAAMDLVLPVNYLNMSYTAKDEAFRMGAKELCRKMVESGHKASPETLLSKVIKNKYPSIYENDWKFVLKKKSV